MQRRPGSMVKTKATPADCPLLDEEGKPEGKKSGETEMQGHKAHNVIIAALLGIVISGVGFYLKDGESTQNSIEKTVSVELKSVHTTLEVYSKAIEANQKAIKEHFDESTNFRIDLNNQLHEMDRKIDKIAYKLGGP